MSRFERGRRPMDKPKNPEHGKEGQGTTDARYRKASNEAKVETPEHGKPQRTHQARDTSNTPKPSSGSSGGDADG